ncbi:MAG: SNF2 helicase-associated domain-containing protein [Planctomycetota bacterium]
MDLTLTPSGHLLLVEEASPSQPPGTAGPLAPIQKAFEQGSADGLLALVTLRGDAPLPPALAWWRRFGERYLTALCHVPEPAEDLKSPLPPPSDDLAALVDSAPPMRGGEYLRAETAERLWTELDTHCREDIRRTQGGLSEWLRERNPLWHRVGRVSFHLAENKRDPECPFAFLATYAPRLLDHHRVQYLPLGKALQEYAGAKNKQALVNLLTPVQRASERCPWVKDLVDSGDVFHPLRWSPAEAHRFLKDVPALEESGLLVRMPDWWTKKPPRVRAEVSLGSSGHSFFGADTLLDFRVRPCVDGEPLSDEEWREVLAARVGLLQLKGRWVEVDREKLQQALDHWKRVKRDFGEDGVSFLAGMRLLAGAPIEAGQEGAAADGAASWTDVHAGPWLEERLREIRQPEAFPSEALARDLQATLRPYQSIGVRWLWTLARLGLGACLADDMGLGKTLQVLALLLLRKRERAPDPAILVLPASLLGNWKGEIERFAPSLSVRFLHPGIARGADFEAAQRDPKRALAGADAVFTTYGMLSRLDWLSDRKWGLAVLDEAQAIKNPSARQTKAAKRLQAAAREGRTAVGEAEEEGRRRPAREDRGAHDRALVLGQGVVRAPGEVQRLRQPPPARTDLRAERVGVPPGDREGHDPGEGQRVEPVQREDPDPDAPRGEVEGR